MDHYVDPTKETFAAFRANNCEGPVHMLNLIRLHERAQYPDSRQASGADAYAAYGHHSAPVLARLGGRIVWRGSFELMLIGPREERSDISNIPQNPSEAAYVYSIG